MITGHEDVTHELTEQELELATKLIPAFKGRNKDNPIKAPEIVNKVNAMYNPKPKFSEVRLRKIVNYYRSNAILPLISTSNGYFVSYDPADINEMVQSLSQRASSIYRCAHGLQNFLPKSKLI
jgi:hypothetical protein